MQKVEISTTDILQFCKALLQLRYKIAVASILLASAIEQIISLYGGAHTMRGGWDI